MIAAIETLEESVQNYQLVHSISNDSAYLLLRSCTLFGEYLGKSPTTLDLTDENVSKWVEWLESKDYSRRTVAGYRANLLSLWRDCAERRLCDFPRRVRKAPKPKPMPVAWCVEDVIKMIAACHKLPGMLWCGISRSFYFELFLRFGWETGLRKGDIWKVEKSDIRDCWVYVRQSKTGVPIQRGPLSERVIEMLDSTSSTAPLSWQQSESQFDYWFRKLKTIAKINNGKHAHGLRASAATDLARKGATPYQIQQFLGHTSIVSQNNYIDRSIARPDVPQPTSLG